jgi:ADP-ribose pyrophosphatase YjhB (NUDIX family)
MNEPNSHCGFCGAAFAPQAPWPRTCAACGNTSFLNPFPVAVALVPVDAGLLVVRRGIEPGRGGLALPGGYINRGESWQEGCAREVREETGLTLDPALISEFGVRSAPHDSLLIFGLCPPLRQSSLAPFQMDAETLECLVIYEPQALVFSLHTEMVRDYFAGRRALPSLE